MLTDLRYALRVLGRSPGFAAVAILVLALGIGANTAVFSVINAVLLRPLPYPESDRLISFNVRTPTMPGAALSYPDYLDYRAAQKTFTDLAISDRETFNLSYGPLGGGAAPERVNGLLASGNYLTVLGVPPVLGRNFSEAEDTPGGPKTVIIGHGLWQRRFASNPAVVGQSLVVEGEPREIIGVLSASLDNVRSTDVLVPLGDRRQSPGYLERDNHPGLYALGRLRPGVTVEAARADLALIAADLERRYPASNTGWTVVVRPLLEQIVGDYRRSLYLLLGSVACVLLIACANVANLQLARAAGRTKELAVRAALGANRWRLIRQALTESTLLGVLGGAAGLLLAMWANAAIIALSPSLLSRFQEIRLDAPTLTVAAVVALLTGLLSGAWPAWRLSSAAAMSRALHESAARGASGGAGQRQARAILVVAQVALAVVLLAGAGMTLRAFQAMQNEPLGFRPENVLLLSVSLPDAQYGDKNPEKTFAFCTRLLDQTRALPGVNAAALGTNLPFSGSDWETSIHVTGTPPDKPGSEPEVHFEQITPDYFKALGVPLLNGREFAPEDRLGQQKAVIIDELVAKRLFPGRDPVGQYLDDNQTLDKNPPPLRIVGVVPHLRLDAPGAKGMTVTLGEMYTCALQRPPRAVTVAVRVAGGDPLRLSEGVRQIVLGLDPELPVAEITTMQNEVAASLAPQRLTMSLLGVFALVALGLATVGLYGVMALSVTQRTRELGIRLALGAQRGAVLALVLRQGATLVAVGLGIGVVAALALGQVLARVLYGVGGSDLLTLGAVCMVLAAAALLACWLPARRATRLDPMVALRDE
ncbi:MAG: ABC transporter permease [Gluconacetobacter diazotrophicus]|nr:ABC transporter permease [Gluconacetobacter diazotrophicus]